MIYFLNIFITIILSILSLTFLNNIALFNVTPILPLFYVTSLTYFRKGFEPILLSVLAGLIYDFFSATPFGFYLILFLAIASLVRIFYQEGMKEMTLIGYFSFVSFGLLAMFLGQVAVLFFGDVAFKPLSLLVPFVKTFFVNMLWALLLYFAIIWYFEKVKVLENKLKLR